jgi:hypothetical protein
VWCQDEQRLGLKQKICRVWTPVGEQPIASVKTQYQWLWVYGFVHPESGETYFAIAYLIVESGNLFPDRCIYSRSPMEVGRRKKEEALIAMVSAIKNVLTVLAVAIYQRCQDSAGSGDKFC